MCVWDGKSGAVGEDPGLSECKECRDALLLREDNGGWNCDCMVDVVGDVTMIFGLSCVSKISFGNGAATSQRTKKN